MDMVSEYLYINDIQGMITGSLYYGIWIFVLWYIDLCMIGLSIRLFSRFFKVMFNPYVLSMLMFKS